MIYGYGQLDWLGTDLWPRWSSVYTHAHTHTHISFPVGFCIPSHCAVSPSVASFPSFIHSPRNVSLFHILLPIVHSSEELKVCLSVCVCGVVGTCPLTVCSPLGGRHLVLTRWCVRGAWTSSYLAAFHNNTYFRFWWHKVSVGVRFWRVFVYIWFCPLFTCIYLKYLRPRLLECT